MKTSPRSILYLICVVAGVLILALLNACSSPGFPLKLTRVSVLPEPVVGRVVTLTVEAMSTRDEPDAAILVDLPKGVKLVAGDLAWHGSLIANHPQAHELTICVLYAGDWRLWIETYSRLSPNSTYQDAETLYISSTAEAAKIVPGSEYKIPPPNSTLTSLPQTPPAVCP